MKAFLKHPHSSKLDHALKKSKMKGVSILTFLILIVIAAQQSEARPFFGSFPWHQLNVGSIKTIYANAQGSR